MPKDTFYRLSTSKQSHIEQKAKQVFLNVPYTNVNIAMIIKAADIPRGSFYQYFTSLEDLYQHLFVITLEAYETKHLEKVLKTTKKHTLHTWALESFASDYAFLSTSDHIILLGKFFKERKMMNISLEFMKERQEQFFQKLLNILDLKVLSSLEADKILKLMHWIQHIKFQKIHKIINESETYKQAYQDYRFFVDVLYKGARELYA